MTRNFKLKYYLAFILLLSGLTANSQTNYSLKSEVRYLNFLYNTIKVDPGSDWKGYYLDENGFELDVINGTKDNDWIFTGIGIGYMNFYGVNGFSIFPELEFVSFKNKFSPLVTLRIGYSHIWNQYYKGTGTILAEIDGGLNFKLNEQLDIYLKSGFLRTQQSFLIPVTIGIRY